VKDTQKKGDGHLYLRGEIYWIKYYRDGKPYFESTKKTDAQQAGKVLKKRLAEIMTGTFIGPRIERIRIAELAEDFLRDYKINGRRSLDDAEARWLLHLKPVFGHLRALQVSTSLINKYVDDRQKAGASNATINRELAALKRMFTLGAQATPPKVTRVPHFNMLKETNVRSGFVTDEQYDALANACAAVGMWIRALFETGYTFGWRVSELLTLQVRQVDFSAGAIQLDAGSTKNDEARVAKMTSTVRALLAALASGKKPNERLFTREGEPIADFRHSWARVCCKAGVGKMVCPDCAAEEPVEVSEDDRGNWRCTRCSQNWKHKKLRYVGLMFHDLRRTAVRNMVRAGIPERVAMSISGHKTRSVFERYNIVCERDLNDAAAKMENRLVTKQLQGPQPLASEELAETRKLLN